jgi:hypothetical protein
MSVVRRHRSASIWLSLVVALGPCIDIVQASKVRPVNLEEMTQRAAVIFSGRCIDVRVVKDPLVGTITMSTFEVSRVLKGDAGHQITVKSLGAQPLGAQRGGDLPGMPSFRKNEEVVLFLYGKNTRGLSSPVALGQGKFTILADKQGRKQAVNAYGNARLLEGLSPRARRRLGASLVQLGDEPVLEPVTLLNMVDALVD